MSKSGKKSTRNSPKFYQGFLVNMLIEANALVCEKAELSKNETLAALAKDLHAFVLDSKNLSKILSDIRNQKDKGSYLTPQKYSLFARTVYDKVCEKRGWSQNRFVDEFLAILRDNGKIPQESAQKMKYIRTDEDALIAFMVSLFGHEVAEGESDPVPDGEEKPSDEFYAQSVTVNGRSYGTEALIDAATVTRLLVTGPSGQGKSLFLKNLHTAAIRSDKFSFVILIPLADCVPGSTGRPGPQERILPQAIKDICCAQYAARAFVDQTTIASFPKPVLLLLDGYNELQVSNNPDAVRRIKSDIDYINRQWVNVRMIVTATALDQPFEALVKKGAVFENFKIGTLSGVPEDKHEELLRAKNLSEEMRDLAKIPFFYQLLRERSAEATDSKYRLLFDAYQTMCIRKKAVPSAQAPRYDLYHLLLPYIALKMNNTRRNAVGRTLLVEWIDELLSKKLFCDTCFEKSARELDADADFSAFRNLGADAAINDLLLEGLLAVKESPEKVKLYSFAAPFTHGIWRDFLAAYAAKTGLHALSACYDCAKALREYAVSLNLTPQAAELLRAALGVTAEENAADVFAELFPIKQLPGDAPLLGYIHLAHNAYQFVFYLQLENRLEEDLHSVLSFACCRIKLLRQTGHIDCSDCQREVARIFGHECEYLCEHGNYAEALEWIGFCDEILSDEKVYAILRNQKALIYLNCLHREVAGEKFENLLPPEYQTIDLAAEAESLLKRNAEIGYEYSLNLYGFMKAFPACFLLKAPALSPNPAAAFLLWFRCAKENSSPAGIYALRQAVALLVGGYITIATWNNGRFPVPPEDVLNRKVDPLKLPGPSIDAARDLLALADGYDAPMLNYLRGCVAETAEAQKAFFSSPLENECPLLYHIRSNYDFGGNYNLDEDYKLLAKTIAEAGLGKFNRKHPIYIYIDAKRLELAYQPKRAEFFASFEAQLCPPLLRAVRQFTGSDSLLYSYTNP